jgi:hypothetical protein
MVRPLSVVDRWPVETDLDTGNPYPSTTWREQAPTLRDK